MSAHPLARAVPLDAVGRYLHWGVVQLSLTNFLIIVAMLVVFALALVLPFPGHGRAEDEERRDER